MSGRKRSPVTSGFGQPPSLTQQIDGVMHGGEMTPQMADALRRLNQSAVVIDGKALVPTENGEFTFKRFRLSSVGIADDGDAGLDEYNELGDLLFALSDASYWWLADWLNKVHRVWGRTIEAISELTGRDAETLYNQLAVGRNVNFPLRNGKLSPSHHIAVAYLKDGNGDIDQNAQHHWLELAENNDWSVREMREAMKQKRQPTPPPSIHEVFNSVDTEKNALVGLFDAIDAIGQGDLKAVDTALNLVNQHKRWLSDLERVLKEAKS